jgi:outer membrane receptor protein involved in Fe transport
LIEHRAIFPAPPRAASRKALPALVLVLALSGRLLAGTTGIIEGIVKDKHTGETLPGVTVTILSLQRGMNTTLEGTFAIQNVRAGSYDIRFSHVGYRPHVLKGVIVNPDLRTRLVIQLEPSSVEMSEIVVTQEKPPIQTDVTGTTYMVSGDEIKALPLTSVLEVVGYKAGTTLEGNIRGGKTSEVTYLVDGLPVQDVLGGSGALLAVPKSSVMGVSILTGGFEPEYGNALSGVVNIVTRAGSDSQHVTVRADKDDLFGGKQVNHATHFEATASGPTPVASLSYLAVLSGDISDTRWWQDMRQYFSSPIEQSISALGKLDYAVSPTLRLAGQVLYTDRRWHDYDFAWRFNLAGLPSERRRSHRVALSLSHTVADNFFYTVSLSGMHAGQTIGEIPRESVGSLAPYQYDFFLRYIVDGSRSWWLRSTQNNYTMKADGTLNIGGAHYIKFGAEANIYGLSSDIVRFEPRKTFFGKPIADAPTLDFSSAYTYHPWTGSAFIQDKVDLRNEGILLTFGARWDVLNPRASRPAIETVLKADTALLSIGASVPAKVKQQISPRFGLATQVAEHGFFFVNLGWYFQYPLFDYLYTGLDRVALGKGVAAVTGNPNLEPERSVQWEFSLKYSLPHDLVVSGTYFTKSITNLVDTKTFIAGDSKVAGNYGFAEFVNTPNASVYGLEFVVTRERGGWLTGELSYAYQVTEATSGSSYDGFYLAQFGLPPGTRTFPLSWDQRHTVKLTTTLTTPWDFDVTSFLHWHTGRPYTRYPSATGFDRVSAGAFLQNNDRMPAYINIDLRAEKRFRLPWTSSSELMLYVDVRNVANQKNVVWIDSNGRIGGELYDPSGYAVGRRTNVGFQISL